MANTGENAASAVVKQQRDFLRELSSLLNRYSAENASGTPDFILAEYLSDCLYVWNKATVNRGRWHTGGKDGQDGQR